MLLLILLLIASFAQADNWTSIGKDEDNVPFYIHTVRVKGKTQVWTNVRNESGSTTALLEIDCVRNRYKVLGGTSYDFYNVPIVEDIGSTDWLPSTKNSIIAIIVDYACSSI